MHPYLSIPSISDVEPEFWSGKRVLVRADLNVPAAEGATDWLRVDALVPTLKYLTDCHARIVVISHRGDDLSIKSVADYLGKQITIKFEPVVIPTTEGSYLGALARTGFVTVVENLRNDPREEANDPEFVEELVRGFDVFVQDAFSACHRPHASIVGIPAKLPTYLGIQAYNEVQHLSGKDTMDDMVLVIGGAKFDTKLKLIERFLDRARMIVIGGALAHTIYKSRGYQIGKSLCDDGVNVSHIARHPKVSVPQYVVVERGGRPVEILATEVGAEDIIVDAGSASFGILERDIATAPGVIWNGPLGWYEKGYFGATKALVGIIAQNENETIVGGGDTVSALQTLNALDKFTFVSLAGGAMLDFLSNGTLPGLDAIVTEMK